MLRIVHPARVALHGECVIEDFIQLFCRKLTFRDAAIEFVEPGTTNPNPYVTARVFEECRRDGLLVGKGGLYGNTIRMGPPLTLTEDEAREGLEILLAALQTVDAEGRRA